MKRAVLEKLGMVLKHKKAVVVIERAKDGLLMCTGRCVGLWQSLENFL